MFSNNTSGQVSWETGVWPLSKMKLWENNPRTISKDEFEKLKATYDPSRSEKEINALRQQLEKKQAQYVAKENELKEFLQVRENGFKEMYTRDISVLFADVQECISKEAAGMNYDLVIDSSAMNSAPRTKIFPHVNKAFDITPALLEKLNAEAPAGFNADEELKKAGIKLPQ